MIKDSPNPPEAEPEIETETDPVSPYAFLNSRKLHDAAIIISPLRPKKRPKPIVVPVRFSSSGQTSIPKLSWLMPVKPLPRPMSWPVS
jgi:hypothetical protein